ncbi:MAG: hypothetical protein RSF67_09810, partial [Clostridia bacterium]
IMLIFWFLPNYIYFKNRKDLFYKAYNNDPLKYEEFIEESDYINTDNIIPNNTQNLNTSKIKSNTIMPKNIIIISSVIAAIVISITLINSIFDYKKQEMIQKNKYQQIKTQQESKEKIEQEKIQEKKDKQLALEKALKQAEDNRDALWEANADTSGKVNANIVKWIDERYNQEVKAALQRYK